MKKKILSLLFLAASFLSPAANSIPIDSISKYTDWLYTSMNIADSSDFPRSFWERNVETSLEAREAMPWGKRIPMREWLHFVLPVRVNNETPDSSRMVFYREIAPRIKNCTMEEAALEVNHWAHENVTYRPSDARTSSPLNTIRTTFGRCGEESTLVVAAMRAVGIPARQIYTPRWAHTDDNHAWVEVWIDGSWHFLGACEPEPVLDLGWFNAPASQGMLMATNVIGNYDGPEQQLYRDSCYTRINITSNYAAVRKASVRVVDTTGNPVPNAPISFRLYNYAELYPLFSTHTDTNGSATLLCGHGDLVAWATSPDGSKYGIAELDSSTDSVTLTLSDQALKEPMEFLLTPPAASPLKPNVTAAQTAANDARKATEDSIRNAVMSRFYSRAEATEAVAAWGDDATHLINILTETYGNREVMTAFIEAVPANRRREARLWLEKLSVKDWRDITWPIINDFFLSRRKSVNPRIDNENLSTWLSDFDKNIPKSLRSKLMQSPAIVEKWVNDNITIDNEHNPNHFCITPLGVWSSRKADTHSRDIFFVALNRWLGFESYIDPITAIVYARKDSNDDYITAFAQASKAVEGSKVRFLYSSDNVLNNPKYYRHFTISRIENGIPELLNYPDETNWQNDFDKGVSLLPGKYLLTSGRRMADGSVKTRIAEFSVPADGSKTIVSLVVPDEPSQISVIGAFNADPLLPLTGRGTFVAAFVKTNHEPSAHFINELCDNKAQVEQWNRPIVLITSNEAAAKTLTERRQLPANVIVQANPDGAWLRNLAEDFEFEPNDDAMPVVIAADSFNRVMYLTKAYRPGSVDALLEVLARIPK